MASLATSSVETLRPENQFAASSFADVPFAAAARAGSPSIRLLSPGPETANAARPSSTPFGSAPRRASSVRKPLGRAKAALSRSSDAHPIAR